VSARPLAPGAAAPVGTTGALLAAGVVFVAAAATVTVGPVAIAIPCLIAVVAFFLREPLALLALYLEIGLFKSESVVSSLPVDATLALGLLVALVCAVRLVQGRVRLVPFGYALTIAVVSLSLIVSLTWTSATAYGASKTTTWLTVTMLAIGAPFFLFESWRDLRRFFMWTVVIAVPVAILALTHPAVESGRLAGDNTIGTSRLLCVAALILLLGALGSHSRWRLPAVLLATSFVAIAIAVGSRGPVAAFVLALAVALTAWLLRVPKKVAPVLALAAVGVALVPFISLPATSSERISEAARDPIAAFRQDDRSFLVRQAFQLIDDHPVRGAGAGAFATVNPAAKWPHNLFIELWAELGLAAMVIVAVAAGAALVGLFRLAWMVADDPSRVTLVYILLAVFAFNLMAVQVSGNINDNRDFWGMLSIASLVVAGGLDAVPRRWRTIER
jgi:O-antigen ligase